MNFISLSSLRNTSLSSVTATDIYAQEARCVLPIEQIDANNVIEFSKEKYIYRITDPNNSGTFPTLSFTNLSTVYDDANPCYFQFEIEWTTAAVLASYNASYEFLNYPEIQTDGNSYTYYITVRIDVPNNGVLMNCWNMKQVTAT